MRKLVLLAVLTSLFFGLKAQEPLSFEKVITVDSIKKEVIYSIIKQWVAMNYPSKYVLEVDDKESGLMIVNLMTDYDIKGFAYTSYCGKLKFSIRAQIKDGRFKITTTNFQHVPKGLTNVGLLTDSDKPFKAFNSKWDIVVWNDLKQKSTQISEDIFKIFENLKFKSDNW